MSNEEKKKIEDRLDALEAGALLQAINTAGILSSLTALAKTVDTSSERAHDAMMKMAKLIGKLGPR